MQHYYHRGADKLRQKSCSGSKAYALKAVDNQGRNNSQRQDSAEIADYLRHRAVAEDKERKRTLKESAAAAYEHDYYALKRW